MSAATVESYLVRRKDNFLLLRIIAAVAVIYGHSFALAAVDGSRDIFLVYDWGVYSGDIAVDVFFVVSGFMVSGSYLARRDLWDYVKARLLRILPAYVGVLVASAYLLGPVLTTDPLGAYLSNPETLTYVTKNLKFSSDMAWTLPGVFDGHRMTSINGSLWTLPAEMRMYLLVAALGAFGLLRASWFGSAVIASLMILGAWKPSLVALHPEWFRLGAFFCLGILVQLNRTRLQIRHSAMVMLVVVTYVSSRTEAYPYLLGLSIAYFCFWFAYRIPHVGWVERWGDPSYGIYLWGWPVQQVVVHLLPGIRPWENFVLSAVVAIPLGYLSWLALEKRALRLKGYQWRPSSRAARAPLPATTGSAADHPA